MGDGARCVVMLPVCHINCRTNLMRGCEKVALLQERAQAAERELRDMNAFFDVQLKQTFNYQIKHIFGLLNIYSRD